MALIKTQTQIIPHDQIPDLPSYQEGKVRETSRVFLGYDPGKISDPAAFVIVEHKRTGTTTWNVIERPSKPARKVQQAQDLYLVRYIKTLPLNTLYGEQIMFAANLMSRPEMDKAVFVIDGTGIGEQSIERAHQVGLRPVKMVLTGGRESTPQFDGNWNVSKMALFLNLDACMANGSFFVAPGCDEAKEFQDELRMIRLHVGAAGTMQFEAAPGYHDDRVCACAYALWLATRPPPPKAMWGSYSQQGISNLQGGN